MKTIRVRALPAPKPGYAQIPMVPHVAAQARGTKQFIGLRHDATLGEEMDHFVDKPNGTVGSERRKSGGFVSTMKAEEVDVTDAEHAKHYRDALADGDLLAADQATATWACVTFTEPPKQEDPKAEEPAAEASSSTKKKAG